MFNKEDGEMFKEGEAKDSKGLICTLKKSTSGGNMEEWTFIDINSKDPRYCNDDPDCDRGEDEPAGCHDHAYIVTGSKEIDGLYRHSRGIDSRPNLYQGENKFLLKKDNRWELKKGLPSRRLSSISNQERGAAVTTRCQSTAGRMCLLKERRKETLMERIQTSRSSKFLPILQRITWRRRRG